MSTRHARRRPESCKGGQEAPSLGQGSKAAKTLPRNHKKKPGHRLNGARRNYLINDTAVHKDKPFSIERPEFQFYIKGLGEVMTPHE